MRLALAFLSLSLFGFGLATQLGGGVPAAGGGATVTFESNWDNACTGTGSTCLRDNATWDSSSASGVQNMEVELGTSTPEGSAVTGAYVLTLSTNDGDDWLEETSMLVLDHPHHYFRMYVQFVCAWDSFISHPGAEGDGITRMMTDSTAYGNVYWRPVSDGDGTAGSLNGWSTHSNAVATVGDDFTGGNSYASTTGGFNNNPDSTHANECDEWIRMEMWIECPDGDDCLDVAAGTDVAVKIHHRDTVITGTNLGTVYDDSDYTITEYDGTGQTPESFDTFYNTTVGGIAINGGWESIYFGMVATYTGTSTPLDPYVHIDGFAYGASDNADDWIGAHADE